MAKRFIITYDDGSPEQTVSLKGRALVEAERAGLKLDGDSPLESTFRLAHIASGSTEDFDSWLDRVDEVAPVKEVEPGEH